MSAKIVLPCALVVAVLSMGAARAQDAAAPPSSMNAYAASAAGLGAGEALPPPNNMGASAAPGPGPGAGDALPPATGPIPGRLSSWLTYPRQGCCGPLGDPPIATELFLRVGPSLPVEGEVFGGTLRTGWEIQGGARVLFLNQIQDAAWLVDLSLNNIYNQGRNTALTFLQNGTTPVSVHNLNRTFANIGLGREWYWSLPATSPQSKLRLGFDTGFRYGTAQVETFQTQNKTSTAYGAYLALSTDWEIPRGCCTFMIGLRAEWDYTWMHVIPGTDNDLQDVNLLITGGVRF
jgi:hypothetical protein